MRCADSRKIVARSVLLFLVSCLFGPVAFAIPINVTIQAELQKDIFAPSFLGITSNTPVAVQFDMSFDSDDAVFFAAGTPVNLSTGASFSEDSYLLSRNSLTSFSGVTGTGTWDSGDFLFQSLGTSGFSYDIHFLGSISPGMNPGVQFNLFRNGLGDLLIGTNICGLSCTNHAFGNGNSYLEGTAADLLVTRVSITAAYSVPEPGTMALLGLGLLCMGFVRPAKGLYYLKLMR